MKKYKIAVLPGDGIGPETINSAVRVLEAVSRKHNFSLSFTELLYGGFSIDAMGVPLPHSTLQTCRISDAALVGPVGGPDWRDRDIQNSPEWGLIKLRKELGLYYNVRPSKYLDFLMDVSPLRNRKLLNIDLIIIRELVSGFYNAEQGRRGETGSLDEIAYDHAQVHAKSVDRIARFTFDYAMKKDLKVTSVDKANTLEGDRLWREIFHRVSKEYPQVKLEHIYIDSAVQKLITEPERFGVIVTGNLFGDILSDELAVLSGSIGMLGSLSGGDAGSTFMYESVHGTATDLVGMNICNPIGTILSGAMMLEFSLNQKEAAIAVEKAVYTALDDGYRTQDILPFKTISSRINCVGTREMTDAIIERL